MSRVLIVGAGPTGLVLALYLKRTGIDCRIIDKTSGPGTTTRAFAVQARTLELYKQVPGLAEEAVAEGLSVSIMNLYSRGKVRARVPIGKYGEGLTAFPFILIYPQDKHEALLIRYLEKEGVRVERDATLIDMTANGRATIKMPDGTLDTEEYAYICGCDGARSTVREKLGLGFPGDTYEQIFYVADVLADGAAAGGEPYFCLTHRAFCLVFPMARDGTVRLVGVVPEDVRKEIADLSFEDVRSHAEAQTGIRVTKVNWFSAYHVHHRVADRFHAENAFLLGDAAHIHSPAGGQGMNTGIGDAVNLAWKMAAVLKGWASPDILNSYNEERRAFALQLVRTTDRLFTAVSDKSWLGSFVRDFVLPAIFPQLMKIKVIGVRMFKTVSQLIVHYEDKNLNHGNNGILKAGERFPIIHNKPEWHMRLGHDIDKTLYDFCKNKIPVYPLWQMGNGIENDRMYLIRPDGYIGLTAGKNDIGALRRYIDKHHLIFN